MANYEAQETLYAGKLNKHGSLVLHKFVDGKKEPVDMYTITNRGKGRCDCFGSMRTPRCKHIQLAEEVQKLNIPWAGGFYDYDRKLFYTPLDGEGIPLNNLVDIWSMAIEQGKAI